MFKYLRAMNRLYMLRSHVSWKMTNNNPTTKSTMYVTVSMKSNDRILINATGTNITISTNTMESQFVSVLPFPVIFVLRGVFWRLYTAICISRQKQGPAVNVAIETRFRMEYLPLKRVGVISNIGSASKAMYR